MSELWSHGHGLIAAWYRGVDAAADVAPASHLPVQRVYAQPVASEKPRAARPRLGSARLLAHLATARADVRLIGLDISERMVQSGRELLAARSLDQRVTLHVGDMATVASTLRLAAC